MLVFHQYGLEDHTVEQYHIHRFNAEIRLQVPGNLLGDLLGQVGLYLLVLQENKRGGRDREQAQGNNDRYFYYFFNLCSFVLIT
jgi:hypothetical protein